MKNNHGGARPGSGRKKGQTLGKTKEEKSITLDLAVIEYARRYATEHHTSFSSAINDLVRLAISTRP
jgi:hypothetical protein